MKHCSLLCVRWWPLVFIGLPILFMLPLLAFKWRYIEADVAYNTSSNLQSIYADWAQVETMNRGRHVLITGTPPDQNAIDQARRTAEASKGVDKVSMSADVKAPPEFAQLSALVVGNKLQLTGVVSSQAEMDKLLSQAQNAFGEQSVDNRLSIGANTARLPNVSNVFTLLASNAEFSTDLQASIKQNILNIEGEVTSKPNKSLIENKLNEHYQGRVISNLNVTLPPPVKRDDCQNLVNNLLNNSQINFESSKAIITADSFDLLASIKSTAELCPRANFEIAGHTDSAGRLAFNTSLSEARAKAVLDHLVDLGLDKSQLSARGYGPTQPIADNATPEGRAKNRRIEFKIKN